jgi:nucleotide-binding universal stress UspA family protein
MFKRILVPLDGSRFALRAFGYAIEVAQRFESEVILMQVVKHKMPVTTTGGPDIAGAMGAEIAMEAALMEAKRNTTRAKRYLSRKARRIASQDITQSYNVEVGDPAQCIISFSQKEHIDLIVMSTHGKSGLKRAIMGSVADAVIRESGKPVLVISPQSDRKKRSR